MIFAKRNKCVLDNIGYLIYESGFPDYSFLHFLAFYKAFDSVESLKSLSFDILTLDIWFGSQFYQCNLGYT